MANQKLTELTAAGSVAATDIIYVVTTPGATPASRKATVSALVAGAGGPTTIPVPIAQGGTAGTTARLARDNLLLWNNNEDMRGSQSAAGTRNLIKVRTDNAVSVGDQAAALYLESTVANFRGNMQFLVNAKQLLGVTVGAAARQILRLNASDVLELGDAATPSIRALTAFEAASSITLDNNQKLQWKDSGGTAKIALYLASGNTLHLGTSVSTLYLEPTSVTYATIRLAFYTNTPLQSFTVGNAAIRNLLKINTSDVLELGDAATPSITAMTALNVTGNLTATGTGAVKAGGFVTGATGALAAGSHGITSVSRSSAGVYVVTWSAARSSTLYPVTVTPVIATAARATVTLTTTTATVRTFDAADAAADADFTVMMA